MWNIDLSLLSTILMVPWFPFEANTESGSISVDEARAYETRLMRLVNRYNYAIAAQQTAIKQIVRLTERLRRPLAHKLPMRTETDNNNNDTERLDLLERLNALSDELGNYYAAVRETVLNVTVSPKLNVKTAAGLYDEWTSTERELFFLLNADQLRRLAEMREMDKRLSAALNDYRRLVNTPDKPDDVLNRIAEMSNHLLVEASDGMDALSAELTATSDANNGTVKVELVAVRRKFYELAYLYLDVNGAANPEERGWKKETLLHVYDAEAPKRIAEAYDQLAVGLLRHNIKF